MGLMAAMCAAMVAGPAMATTTNVAQSERGRNPKLIPVDRSYRRRGEGNSGSLSKLLASGRRRGRI